MTRGDLTKTLAAALLTLAAALLTLVAPGCGGGGSTVASTGPAGHPSTIYQPSSAPIARAALRRRGDALCAKLAALAHRIPPPRFDLLRAGGRQLRSTVAYLNSRIEALNMSAAELGHLGRPTQGQQVFERVLAALRARAAALQRASQAATRAQVQAFRRAYRQALALDTARAAQRFGFRSCGVAL